MPWRGHSAVTCKGCGRHVDECGPLSARYLCADCGEDAMIANHIDMRARGGLYWRRWRQGMAKAAGALLLEELDVDDAAGADQPLPEETHHALARRS